MDGQLSAHRLPQQTCATYHVHAAHMPLPSSQATVADCSVGLPTLVPVVEPPAPAHNLTQPLMVLAEVCRAGIPHRKEPRLVHLGPCRGLSGWLQIAVSRKSGWGNRRSRAHCRGVQASLFAKLSPGPGGLQAEGPAEGCWESTWGWGT